MTFRPALKGRAELWTASKGRTCGAGSAALRRADPTPGGDFGDGLIHKIDTITEKIRWSGDRFVGGSSWR